MSDKPSLLLLPNLLGDYRHAEVFLPTSVFKVMKTIDGLIAESESEGRRYLKRFETKKPATIASPPSLAMGFLWIRLLSLGMSTAPSLKASFFAMGVAQNATINASIKDIKNSTITPSLIVNTINCLYNNHYFHQA